MRSMTQIRLHLAFLYNVELFWVDFSISTFWIDIIQLEFIFITIHINISTYIWQINLRFNYFYSSFQPYHLKYICQNKLSFKVNVKQKIINVKQNWFYPIIKNKLLFLLNAMYIYMCQFYFDLLMSIILGNTWFYVYSYFYCHLRIHNWTNIAT